MDALGCVLTRDGGAPADPVGHRRAVTSLAARPARGQPPWHCSSSRPARHHRDASGRDHRAFQSSHEDERSRLEVRRIHERVTAPATIVVDPAGSRRWSPRWRRPTPTGSTPSSTPSAPTCRIWRSSRSPGTTRWRWWTRSRSIPRLGRGLRGARCRRGARSVQDLDVLWRRAGPSPPPSSTRKSSPGSSACRRLAVPPRRPDARRLTAQGRPALRLARPADLDRQVSYASTTSPTFSSCVTC